MKRVLLKLSGEALAGDKKTGFDDLAFFIFTPPQKNFYPQKQAKRRLTIILTLIVSVFQNLSVLQLAVICST